MRPPVNAYARVVYLTPTREGNFEVENLHNSPPRLLKITFRNAKLIVTFSFLGTTSKTLQLSSLGKIIGLTCMASRHSMLNSLTKPLTFLLTKLCKSGLVSLNCVVVSGPTVVVVTFVKGCFAGFFLGGVFFGSGDMLLFRISPICCIAERVSLNV